MERKVVTFLCIATRPPTRRGESYDYGSEWQLTVRAPQRK